MTFFFESQMLQSLHFSEVPLPAELDGKGSRCLPETLKYPHWGGFRILPWLDLNPASCRPSGVASSPVG